MTIDEYRLQAAIDALRSDSPRFAAAAQNILARAQYLFGISIDITYNAQDWKGPGSQSFQNAWHEYDLHSRRALEALNHTSSALNNLAQRLENVLQEKQALEQRANALLLATAGLSLVDFLQLGLDPLTDAAVAGTAAASAYQYAQSFSLDSMVAQADSTSASDVSGAPTSSVGGLGTIDQGALTYQGSGSTDVWSHTPGSTGSTEEKNTTESGTHNPSLYFGVGTSVWSDESPETELGSYGGVPLSNKYGVSIDNAGIGVGMQPGDDGTTDVALEGSLSLVQAHDDLTYGSQDLGLTAGVEGEAGTAEGALGWHDDSVTADVGVTAASASGSVGANIGGVNASVNATIGLKAELGFSIGSHTEIKLPFISIGFSIG